MTLVTKNDDPSPDTFNPGDHWTYGCAMTVPAEVNGQPAIIMRSGNRALAVLTIDVEADQIKAIRFVANPDKLAHISR